jgi:hypothetical protein
MFDARGFTPVKVRERDTVVRRPAAAKMAGVVFLRLVVG